MKDLLTLLLFVAGIALTTYVSYNVLSDAATMINQLEQGAMR